MPDLTDAPGTDRSLDLLLREAADTTTPYVVAPPVGRLVRRGDRRRARRDASAALAVAVAVGVGVPALGVMERPDDRLPVATAPAGPDRPPLELPPPLEGGGDTLLALRARTGAFAGVVEVRAGRTLHVDVVCEGAGVLRVAWGRGSATSAECRRESAGGGARPESWVVQQDGPVVAGGVLPVDVQPSAPGTMWALRISQARQAP